jgi:hypothetical protein
VDLRNETNGGLPDRPRSAEENYLERKVAVTQQDYAEFLEYQQEKEARRADPRLNTQATRRPKGDRRNFLTVVAGTAAVGEAATLGYSIVKDQIPVHGAKHGGDTYTEAQRHNIERELINPKSDIGGRGFGNWVLLMPTKLAAAPTP